METIMKLIEILPVGSIDDLGDVDLDPLRIRLTEYAKEVDLSGCPQITSAILLLSMFPPSHCMDLNLWKTIKLSLINPEDFSRDHARISQILQPTLSFEAVERLDISKCWMLHLDAAIELFSKSFPSLRRLKAAYFLNFNIATLCKLVQKCPLLSEVDMTVDITPLIPSEVSVVSCSTAIMAPVSKKSFSVGNNSLDVTFYHSGALLSNITRLVLEGRSDICDSDLQYLTALCRSLEYLNLKGCITITDVGLSNLISSCVKLHSIIACDTSFGMNSIQALCSSITYSGSLDPHAEKRCLRTLACNLQILHVGGCKLQKELQVLMFCLVMF
uniref:BTB/POZ domain-containing protein FBL11 isoform X5 n=1 Tax=Rhizophora mucronata TaxID=61149 RepID=A0A2P2LXB4_RHIMU